MDRETTAQEIARATLDSIELVRRACEGKPKQHPAKEALDELMHDEDIGAVLGGLFKGKGKQ